MTAIPQHMQALEHANEIRCANAEFRREVMVLSSRAAAERVAYTVEHEYDAEACGALRIDRMLRFIPHLGAQKAAKCLIAAGVVNQSKRLRELTPRQRTAIAAQLRLWAFGYRA
jgi:hypothetical protein